ncbi:leucine-rich repeat domain-containing protein [Archangium lansingense]|uniref:WGR domain-containing protein n=1 Tax=Archangium lansingense TaxID=2995310 RepID=A0ABT4AEE7_9BACT|nr:WGR domain-containing protein [Archangium lansinium]MCY1079284.1 WGR domain-containing protein [Archangium lansinium]
MRAPLLPTIPHRLQLRLQGLEGAALKFWSYEQRGASLDLHHGVVGTAGKRESKAFPSEEAAAAFARKTVAAKVAKGYYASELAFETFTWSQVKDEVKAVGNNVDENDRVLVLTGDVVVPHDLWLDYRSGILALADENDSPFIGLIVRGNLTIEGCLANFENDYGPFLQVHGHLIAQRIATGGSQIRVNGDVTTGDLVGVYNHGCVAAGGNLVARTIATEHTISAEGQLDGHRYLGWGAKVFAVSGGVEDRQDPYEAKGVFVSAVVKDGRVDLRKARELLAAGKPISLPEFTSVRGAFRKLVAKKLEDPDKVKSLSLAGKDLMSLPEELFRFRRLEKLDLTHNELRTLPEELGLLTELRELRIRGNGLQTLPESIGSLTKLRFLDLEANCIWRLPESLAQCVELRTVNLTNNPYSYVRASFGGWQKVELMWDFPEVLTRLPKLEELTVHQTLLRTLPTRRFDSTTLRKLTVQKSLVTQVDPELHAQMSVTVEESAQWAVDHIRFWFGTDKIRLEHFYDFKARRYDFTEVIALLGVLLRINIPTAAPYDAALAEFKKQSEFLAKTLNWDGTYGHHVGALFGALRDALDTLGKPYPDNALIAGLRTIFSAHTS